MIEQATRKVDTLKESLKKFKPNTPPYVHTVEKIKDAEREKINLVSRLKHR